jgi:hypothetical protein
MLILSENNSDFIQPNDCFDNQPNFNNCSLTVQFTYSETTGIISDISILNDIQLHHQSMSIMTVIYETIINPIFFRRRCC